jgi:hypothetical protein
MTKQNLIFLTATAMAVFTSPCWADIIVPPAYTQQPYSPALYDALLVIPVIAAYLLYRRNRKKPDA